MSVSTSSNRVSAMLVPTLVLLFLSGCTTVDRVQKAVTSVTNSVTPIRSAPEPVRSPLYYICDANQETRTWECRTTLTSDGTIVEPAPSDSASAPSAAPAQNAEKPVPRPAPASARDTAPAADRAAAVSSGSESQILAADADSWAVQLIALNDEAALQQYAADLGVGTPIYAQTRYDGEPLFVLLLGIYPDRETADAARAAFMSNAPIEVSPWVRPLAPLQQAVRALRAN